MRALALAVVLFAGTSALLAATTDELLQGKAIVLKDGKSPKQRAATIRSEDTALTLGRGNDSPDDPTQQGGSLRIVSVMGDVFDQTYPLPKDGWHYLGKAGQNKGYRFKLGSAAPVKSVVVKAGKLVQVVAKGSKLGHSLASDPNPVQVILALGEQQLCLGFGGTASFKAGKKFTAGDSPAPISCPLPYADDSMWLCRPDKAANLCLVDLDATSVHPDLSTTVEAHVGAADQPYDCFYIYPTVDLSPTPGNHVDFSDTSLELDPLLTQAARLNDSCRIFAPLYRQVTFGTFGSPDAVKFAAIAYADAEAAFRRYLAKDNGGRNVVLLGHSQGTFVMTQIMQNLVDASPELRSRLIVALLIGGSVTVPDGQVVGGSFQNLPLCTSDAQTGCVIAYRSYAEGFPPANGSNTVGPAGMDTACTNPAALGGGEGRFAKTYFPNVLHQPIFQVAPPPPFPTPFTLFEDFYAGECVKDAAGRSYLEIRVRPDPGDMRTDPISYTHPALSPSLLGTHILDYSWALGDLIRLVQTKAAAMP